MGPLVSVHSVGCSLSDPYSFTDMARSCVTLFAKNFCLLPIDYMIVLYRVVSDSWLGLFTFWLLSGLPCIVLFTGFHFLSLFHVLKSQNLLVLSYETPPFIWKHLKIHFEGQALGLVGNSGSHYSNVSF